MNEKLIQCKICGSAFVGTEPCCDYDKLETENSDLKHKLMLVYSKASWMLHRFKLPDGCNEELDEILQLTGEFRNFERNKTVINEGV